MKKRVILSSILSLVLCVSLIAGSTFALFTSESKTNIAVTSGKVDVKAAFSISDVYSPTLINTNSVVEDNKNASTWTKGEAEGTFANGGTVKVDGEKVTFTNMTPGDKVTFEIKITNSTNVEFMQRITIGLDNEADKAFFDQLLVGYDDGTGYKYYSDFATAWTEGTVVTGEPVETTQYLTVEMPTYVGDKWQDKTCSFTLAVNAVQGNANVTDTADAKEIKFVDATNIGTVLAAAESGDTIYVDAPIDTLNVAFTDAKEITLRGHYIETLNVNAPNGTLNVYNHVGTINGASVAQKSLHIYGEVANIVLNNGRVVVADGAEVDAIELAPQKETHSAILAAEENAVVGKVVINAAHAKATIAIANPLNKEVIPEAEYAVSSAIQKDQGVTDKVLADDGEVKALEKIEASTEAGAPTVAEKLNNVITEAKEPTVVVVPDGSYTLPPVSGKDITIAGSEGAVVDMTNAVNASNSNVAFEGVTVEYKDTASYVGLQHSSKVVYKDCVIKGTQFLYAPDVEFINCTFVNNDNAYCVWTYGASNVTFTDCTFNTTGKAILVYTEAAHTATITANNCEFNDSNNGSRKKGAIEIGESANGKMANYTIIMNDCEVNGFAVNDEGSSSTSVYWGNKNDMPKDRLNVIIDGVDVY